MNIVAVIYLEYSRITAFTRASECSEVQNNVQRALYDRQLRGIAIQSASIEASVLRGQVDSTDDSAEKKELRKSRISEIIQAGIEQNRNIRGEISELRTLATRAEETCRMSEREVAIRSFVISLVYIALSIILFFAGLIISAPTVAVDRGGRK